MTPPQAPAAGRPFAVMLRGAFWPTLVVGAVCAVVGLVASGATAAWSAALGAAIVLVFFSVSLLVMRFTSHLAPTTVMAVVLASYTAKVVALGAVLFVLKDATFVSGYAVGITVTLCALVWMFFELRAYSRLRILVFDEGEDR